MHDLQKSSYAQLHSTLYQAILKYKEKTLEILDKILKDETPKPGSYRGRVNNEPENNRKTLLDVKNA